MTQSNDSVGATGLVAEEAVDVTASTAADTDDKEVNEQQASLVGPALKPDSVSAYTTASQILYHRDVVITVCPYTYAAIGNHILRKLTRPYSAQQGSQG